MTTKNKLICILAALLCFSYSLVQPLQHSAIVDVTNLQQGKFETDYWLVTKQPGYKLDDLVIQSQASACIKLQHEITTEGKFTNPKIIKQVNGELFEQALLQSLYNWRWQATKGNETSRLPIITTRFFSIGPNTQISEQCF